MVDKRSEFINLAAKAGYKNPRLINEWYRSQRRAVREETANSDLLVQFQNTQNRRVKPLKSRVWGNV
jgi:hypothetical protein